MQNGILQTLALFSPLDFVGVAFLIGGWMVMGWYIERGQDQKPSTHTLMTAYRERWMEVMITRSPRIFDANILSTLRQGTSFFISAVMLAIGGCVALIGQADRLRGFATDLTGGVEIPIIVWEVKILLVIILLSSAFLKFVWSHRLFGYTAIVMAAVPETDPDSAATKSMAQKAAKLNIYAARSFNRGLRATYFSLAALAWLIGAYALICAALLTCYVLYQREFNSQSRAALLDD